MALISSNFASVLDPRFKRIWDERFTDVPDMISDFYDVQTGKLNIERFSTVGTTGEMPLFNGSITYDDISAGYNTLIEPLEFGMGIQIERKLFDDEQFSIIDQKPKALAGSLFRRRQIDAARPFNNAFSVDSYFGTNSEGVAMCSNSHTTTSGASTSAGFDNLVTTSLSAVALAAARIQMVQFRGDRAEIISVNPSQLLIPPDLYEIAFEITNSMGKVDTANNNKNVHNGQYSVKEWNYLTDANNWFLMDSGMMKDFGLIWVERVKGEFGFIEDFDTLVGKWRAYARYGNGWVDWRFILGASV